MLRPVTVTYGTDPEGFFQRDGQIIGSQKVISEHGLLCRPIGKPFVVQDGVQFELNPTPATSALGLAGNISVAFSLLRSHLEKMNVLLDPQVKLCFDRIVTVSREELDGLSQRARELGCQPSLNIYGPRPLKCDVKTYLKRSSGGHIHLGLGATNIFSGGNDERQRLIPLLDIFVGNFCVLLDRDPGAAERRENYGRAGEFRLPEHGVEYRTPDNFWLRNYALLTFVLGMSNLATSVLVHTIAGGSQEDELVSIVDIKRVIRAIDKNDFKLAKKNIEDLRPWLAKNLPESGFPLRPGTISKFLELGNMIEAKGIASVFPEDPMTHWTGTMRNPFSAFLETL